MPGVCDNCSADITTQPFVRHDDKRYCQPCYQKQFGKHCERCQKEIPLSEKAVRFNDKNFHDGCFTCADCGTRLSGKPIFDNGGTLQCEKCSGNEIDPDQKCPKCHKPLDPTQPRAVFGGQLYHNDCFKCDDCDESLANKTLFNTDGKLICSSCQEKRSGNCRKCDKPVAGGVSFNDGQYHPECFHCSNDDCKEPLANKKIMMHDGKPYCQNCYQAHFAPKCAACQEPIAGGYVTCGKDAYHPDCFKCSKCEKSLSGKKFFQRGDDKVCADCN